MFSKKKSFSTSKIGETKNYTSYSSATKSFFAWTNVFKYLVVFFCLVVVFYLGKYLVAFSKAALWEISKSTVGIISDSFWKDMKLDEFWNINILLVWLGWGKHAGWYLADSIIVASYKPKLWAITMISVPRDFYIYDKKRNAYGKINSMFARGYSAEHGELSWWAEFLSEKLEQVLGLKIPYYAIVDFNGFETMIDTLGGIDIYVPKGIHDVTYPDGELWYMTFDIQPGQQHIDGKTALMYARSRHTTSDYARSARQQAIIKAILNQAFKSENITNISKIKKLYNEYKEIVTTNIKIEELIGMAKYMYDFQHIFSFGLTTECSYRDFDLTGPGCFLYTPDREQFWGASVSIPMWAALGKLEFYDYIKNFTFYVAHNQEYLIENPTIVIQNGIDKALAKKLRKDTTGRANRVAVKLKKYGFNVIETENSDKPYDTTMVYIGGTGEYKDTIKTLQNFIPTLQKDNVWTGQMLTGGDISIILGNDYIQSLTGSSFSYEK